MKYERPEAELQEFKTLEENAVLGWGKSNGKMLESTSLFSVEEDVDVRENFQ